MRARRGDFSRGPEVSIQEFSERCSTFVLADRPIRGGAIIPRGNSVMSIFGRKKAVEADQPKSPKEHPGHQAVLAHLRDLDKTEPERRPQFAGSIVFDLVCQMVADKRGVRIEDVVAILASVGGHLCLDAAMAVLARKGGKMNGAELVVMGGADGNRYYFGDLPNQFLLESRLSLLSLALGAAQANGGVVSLEKVHDVMKHVAGTAGSDRFGVPRISGEHRPGDVPYNHIKYLAPRIVDALELYDVPAESRPAAMGFALQCAIEAGKSVLDPTIAADIATEFSVPAAKFDPARFR